MDETDLNLTGKGREKMTKSADKGDKWIAAGLILGVILVNIKGIFTDFDLDCEYAIAMSYRMAQGDRMFVQMWEPHQTSAFLNAILIKIFLWLTGSVDGIVLYLNTVGVLARGLAAGFYYQTFRNHMKPKVLFFSCVFFLTVTAKDYLLLDFSNMQIYFSLMLFCCMFRYLQDQNRMGWLIGAAVFLCLQCLSYPTCALNYIVIVFILLRVSKRKGRDIGVFSGICFAAGGIYLLYFMLRSGAEEFFTSVAAIVAGDGSHQMRWGERLNLYGRDASQILLLFLICGGASFVIVCLGRAVFGRKVGLLQYSIVFFCLLFLENVISVIGAWEWFKLYVAVYYPILIVAVMLVKNCDQKEQQIFYMGIALSGISCLAVLLLTNLSLLLTTGYFILGIMVCMVPVGNMLEKPAISGRRNVISGVICLFLLAALFRNGFGMFSMSRGGGFCSNILSIGGVVKEGPAIGIFSDYMGPYIMEHNYNEWRQNVNPGDRVLIVSENNVNPLGYLYEDTIVSAYSTICTPTYNEKLLEYWERNPDRFPSVVAVECWYGDLKLSEDSWIMEWVEENFHFWEDGTFLRFYH